MYANVRNTAQYNAGHTKSAAKYNIKYNFSQKVVLKVEVKDGLLYHINAHDELTSLCILYFFVGTEPIMNIMKFVNM